MYLIQIPQDLLQGSEGQSMKKYFGTIHWERGLGKKQRAECNGWWGGRCSRIVNERQFSVCRRVVKTCRNLVRLKCSSTKASGRNVVCFKHSLTSLVKALSIKVKRWPTSRV